MELVSIGKCWVDSDRDYCDAGGYFDEDLREIGEVYLIDVLECEGSKLLAHLQLPSKGEVYIYVSPSGKFELVPLELIKQKDDDNSADENTKIAVQNWLSV